MSEQHFSLLDGWRLRAETRRPPVHDRTIRPLRACARRQLLQEIAHRTGVAVRTRSLSDPRSTSSSLLKGRRVSSEEATPRRVPPAVDSKCHPPIGPILCVRIGQRGADPSRDRSRAPDPIIECPFGFKRSESRRYSPPERLLEPAVAVPPRGSSRDSRPGNCPLGWMTIAT